jgi:hypothetical protein
MCEDEPPVPAGRRKWLTVRQPWCEGADADDARVVGNREGRPGTHGMAEQGDRNSVVPLSDLA